MHVRVILRVTGALLGLFSATLLLPIGIALVYSEDPTTFVVAAAITLSTGVVLWCCLRVIIVSLDKIKIAVPSGLQLVR